MNRQLRIPFIRTWFAWLALVCVILCLVLTPTAMAQILQGPWVDASEAAIEKHRKTDVTVIVLDENDKAVQGAKVRLTQERHDFVLGLNLPNDRMPPDQCRQSPLYRCFNAIAMDRYTDWSLKSHETPEQLAKRLAAWREELEPIRKQFGRVISADPALNPDRLSLLESTDLRDTVFARIDLATTFKPQADELDLYTDLMQQDLIERKLGQGMLHRVFDRAKANQPKANFGIRVRDAISLRLGRDLASTVRKLEVRQVPFEHITVEQRFTGPLQPNALKRMLDEYIAPLPKPVTLAGLEAGGPTPVAAAINLETILRLSFAQPRITGIYFAGLSEDEVLEENTALIDADGKPTASGELIDDLFTKHWHSDETGQTDERGNVQARVFTGWYSITATLPDGTTMTTRAYIPKSDRNKFVVLQATQAETK